MMKIKTALLSVLGMFALGVGVGITVIPQPTPIVVRVPSQDDGTMKIEYPKHPTHQQSQLLALAYDIANKDGIKWPQVLQGIILQETNAGNMHGYKVAGHPNARYYGVGQVKLSTARTVLRRYPEMKKKFHFDTLTNEEITAKLIEDDVFNLSVASKYLLILQQMGYTTMAQLAAAYNKGPGGAEDVDADTDGYAVAVMAQVEHLNAKHD